MTGRHRLFRAMIVSALSLWLAGCGSSPPVRYFSLEPAAVEYTPDPAGSPVLGIGPLRFPEYLRRSQLVRRGEGHEILVDADNRWAESLDAAIHRILAANVDALLDGTVAVGFPDTDALIPRFRMLGRVLRFDVDMNGNAVLDVQWYLQTDSGDALTGPLRNTYRDTAGDPQNAALVAAALNRTLDAFSRDVAEQVRALGTDSPEEDQ